MILILSGPSGIGKSTVVREEWPDAMIVSADHYFGTPYRFDPSKLAAAHASCFLHYLHALQAAIPEIVVDNTNTTTWEISPYVLAAQAYGRVPRILTMMPEVALTAEILAARNEHDVPAHTIAGQIDRLRSRELPLFWPAETIEVVTP